MSFNKKYEFHVGEKVVLRDGSIGQICLVYLATDFIHTNMYFVNVKMGNGDDWVIPFNDEWSEEQYKESVLYNLVHKIGNRVFGELLDEEFIKQIKNDHINGIHYIDGKCSYET